MKRIAVIALGLFLTFGYVAHADVSEADQKWLKAVESMVAEGKTKVSTPSQDRVSLIKEWGAKKGYSVEVTKTESGFQLLFTKKSGKIVAQAR